MALRARTPMKLSGGLKLSVIVWRTKCCMRLIMECRKDAVARFSSRIVLAYLLNFQNQHIFHPMPRQCLPRFVYTTVRDALSDLPSLAHGEGTSPMEYNKPPQTPYQILMRRNSEILFDHVARKLADTQYRRLAAIVAGQGARDLPDELKPKSHYSGAYGRLEWDSIAPTITRWVFHPGSGRFGHPSDVRVITIREAARLQSFSDDFIFTGTYIQKSHQVGNAVPPLVMQAFGDKMRELLRKVGKQINEAHRVNAR